MNNRVELSIVISTFNELSLGYLENSLSTLSKISNLEIICVDGKSTDGTLDLLNKYKVKLIETRSHSRAHRLNIGIQACSCDLILLYHPRSFVDPAGIKYLKKNSQDLLWGGFSHQFDKKHWLLKFTSWYSNEVRARLREIFYLDHCIYFKRSLLPEDQQVVNEVVIFEDTLFSQKLSRLAPAKLLEFSSTTSAIRFNKNGVFRQALLNQVLKVCFLLGLSDELMNKVYEKGLALNSKY